MLQRHLQDEKRIPKVTEMCVCVHVCVCVYTVRCAFWGNFFPHRNSEIWTEVEASVTAWALSEVKSSVGDKLPQSFSWKWTEKQTDERAAEVWAPWCNTPDQGTQWRSWTSSPQWVWAAPAAVPVCVDVCVSLVINSWAHLMDPSSQPRLRPNPVLRWGAGEKHDQTSPVNSYIKTFMFCMTHFMKCYV